MRTLLPVVIVGAFTSLASAQVAAPDTRDLREMTDARSFETLPSGAKLMRGDAWVKVFRGQMTIKADEIEQSRDGLTFTLRGNAGVRLSEDPQ